MKAGVENELIIPQQRRFIVPIDLGGIERMVENTFAAYLEHRS